MSDSIETLHEEQLDTIEKVHEEQKFAMPDEPIEQLRVQLAECQMAAAEWQEKWLRANADFDNLRKRTVKDQALWRQTAQIEVILPIISILDDFDRALETVHTEHVTNAQLEGFSLIHKSLNKYLHTLGVEVMTEYDTFNPEYHEAIMQVDAPGCESGRIVDVLEKGYLFKGIVLRPAKVSVAK